MRADLWGWLHHLIIFSSLERGRTRGQYTDWLGCVWVLGQCTVLVLAGKASCGVVHRLITSQPCHRANSLATLHPFPIASPVVQRTLSEESVVARTRAKLTMAIVNSCTARPFSLVGQRRHVAVWLLAYRDTAARLNRRANWACVRPNCNIVFGIRRDAC